MSTPTSTTTTRSSTITLASSSPSSLSNAAKNRNYSFSADSNHAEYEILVDKPSHLRQSAPDAVSLMSTSSNSLANTSALAATNSILSQLQYGDVFIKCSPILNETNSNY